MNDMLQYIRARRAGHTPEAMLQAKITSHQEALAERSQQIATQALQHVTQNQETSESLNNMVEQAQPLQPAQEQLKKLQEMNKNLKSLGKEASTDLEKVQADLEDQEKHKMAADAHFKEVAEALSQKKETIPHLPFIYEAGSRASDSMMQRDKANMPSSASVRNFLNEKASQDSQKPFELLEERFAARKANLARIQPNTQQRINTNGSNLPSLLAPLSERLQRLMLSGKPCRENGNGAQNPF